MPKGDDPNWYYFREHPEESVKFAADRKSERQRARVYAQDLHPLNLRADRHIVSEQTIKLYGRRIGPKLKALVAEQLENPKHLDVREELAIIRHVNAERLGLLSAVMEMPEGPTEDARAAQREMKSAAEALVMQSNQDVIAACEKVAKIDTLAASNTSPYAIDLVVRQICQFVHRIFGADIITDKDDEATIILKQEAHERIRLFEEALDTQLELPSIKGRGTTITPDQQVIAMDGMIPTQPEVEVNDVQADAVNS